eukprot:COSAG02_NODE_2140_length_9686_cov_7.536664_3_plen_101_part_00
MVLVTVSKPNNHVKQTLPCMGTPARPRGRQSGVCTAYSYCKHRILGGAGGTREPLTRLREFPGNFVVTRDDSRGGYWLHVLVGSARHSVRMMADTAISRR